MSRRVSERNRWPEEGGMIFGKLVYGAPPPPYEQGVWVNWEPWQEYPRWWCVKLVVDQYQPPHPQQLTLFEDDESSCYNPA